MPFNRFRVRLAYGVMKIRRYAIIASLSTVAIFAPGSAVAECHYVDPNGASIPGYEDGYAILRSYFGDAVPRRITIDRTDKPRSLFQPNGNRVLISTQSRYKEYNSCSVEHESSHLSLFAFTQGASLREEFRFVDEGFATIVQAQACRLATEYKRKALRMAARAMKEDGISFAKVQKWSDYFGIPERGNVNWDAYQTGASFNYYLWDTYGKARLLDFFTALGDRKELEAALSVAFGKDKATIEREWLAYLEQPLPEAPVPQIIRLHPEHMASGVPLDTAEIFVEFDLPMQPSYSLLTRCDDGVCYRDAYWKSDRILAIKVKLIPSHEYRLAFGNEQKNIQKFISVEGAALPFREWIFRTARP